MLKMYLKTALRNLLKQRFFSLINILGLALGITASVLIFLWVNHETSFDKFNTNYKHIYRLAADASFNGQNFNVCFVPSPMAKEMAEKCPEVVLSTRISPYFDLVYQYSGNYFKEKKVISADSNFFKVFSYPFIEGDPQKPFLGQNSVVLTKSVAIKIFGNEKATGKLLLIDGQDPLTVSGVIEDLPSTSHMQFSMAISMGEENNWGNFNRLTYLLLKDNFDKNIVNKALDDVEQLIVKQMATAFGMTLEQFMSGGNHLNIRLQPLSSIHLNSNLYGELETPGNKTMVFFFSIIAILILVIASINYMNLSTAYYDNRRQEVGIRKANGATRNRLMWQFLSESFIISLIAFVFGIILIKIFLPLFSNYLDINLNEGIYNHWYFTLLVLGLIIIVGLISGLYPAIYLAHFKTVAGLQKINKTPLNKLMNTRSALVVFQFVITIVVIVSTIVIKKQVDFLLNKDLGFNKQKMVVIEGANNLGSNKEAFREELKQNPMIVNLTYSDVYPSAMYNNVTTYSVEGYSVDQQFILKTIQADAAYFDTYEMKIVQGRDVKPSDVPAIVLNQKAVDLLKMDDPIHNKIRWNGQSYNVIGVVKNFYHDPLNVALDPIIIRVFDNRYFDYLTIRLAEGNTKDAMSFISDKWSEFSGNKPFEYFFLDSKLNSVYKAENKAGSVFTTFSILSVIIACMGLLGISSFMLQRKTKEIGIRKVNGARISEVITLLNTDFIKWVIIAFMIATPIAYFAMHKWLNNFANKIELSWWAFALAGFLVLLIALITVSWQTLNAARRNPVEALRYE